MSAVPRPTIHISPVVPADFPSLARAELTAMEDDWLYRRLYPADLRPSSLEQRIDDLIYTKTLAHERGENTAPGHHPLKATLDGAPEAVAYGCWEAPKDGSAWAEEEKHLEKTEREKELDKQFNGPFFARFKDEMRRVEKVVFPNGEKHWYLSLLYVSPEAQGKGVARALVQWGVDRAREDGVPVYLEASVPGLPVYEKIGFKTVTWCEVEDPEAEGGKTKWPAMVLRP